MALSVRTASAVLSVAGAMFAARRYRANEAALEDRSPGALRSAAPEVASGLESSRCVAMAGRTIISYSSVVRQLESVESPVISCN